MISSLAVSNRQINATLYLKPGTVISYFPGATFTRVNLCFSQNALSAIAIETSPMQLSQEKKTETGLFNSHSVHFCTFVYTQVIGPCLRSASFPLGVPGLGDCAQFKRKMVAGFVMVMVGVRDWFDEYDSSNDFVWDVKMTKI